MVVLEPFADCARGRRKGRFFPGELVSASASFAAHPAELGVWSSLALELRQLGLGGGNFRLQNRRSGKESRDLPLVPAGGIHFDLDQNFR